MNIYDIPFGAASITYCAFERLGVLHSR